MNNYFAETSDLLHFPIVIWGIGSISELYMEGFERDSLTIAGVCDSNPNSWGKTLLNTAVSSPVEFLERAHDSDYIFVICSWRIDIIEAISYQISEAGGTWISIDEYVWLKYQKQFEQCMNLLADNRSREVYWHIVQQRIQGHMPLASFVDGGTYFGLPEFAKYGKAEVFVDCGAYVGDSVEQFIWKKQTFDKIYAFEPDIKNFVAMEKRVSRLKSEWGMDDDKIILLNYAVGDVCSTMCTVNSSDIGSMVKDYGEPSETCPENKIPMTTIDSYFANQRYSFLKADVESFEYKLILGAETTIRSYKPRLAICIYHSMYDMFAIMLLLHRFVPEYRFAVRHHSYCYDETVLYAWIENDNRGWIV